MTVNIDAQKNEVFHYDLFSKCDQIRRKLHNGKLHFSCSVFLPLHHFQSEMDYAILLSLLNFKTKCIYLLSIA